MNKKLEEEFYKKCCKLYGESGYKVVVPALTVKIFIDNVIEQIKKDARIDKDVLLGVMAAETFNGISKNEKCPSYGEMVDAVFATEGIIKFK